ncbi:MAG: hypothetical protein AB1472_03795 [Candidatus Omnitrophota bacterium]
MKLEILLEEKSQKWIAIRERDDNFDIRMSDIIVQEGQKLLLEEINKDEYERIRRNIDEYKIYDSINHSFKKSSTSHLSEKEILKEKIKITPGAKNLNELIDLVEDIKKYLTIE